MSKSVQAKSSSSSLWSAFFVLAGISNLSQSWFFWASGDPLTSGATLMGFKPSMPIALLNALCDLVGDIDPCPDVFVSLTLNPDFGSKWDATVWIVVAVAGLCYVAHGLTGCRLPRGLMMLFGLLKLQTAATLAVLWAAGQPGPLTLGIAVSEVVWGALFFKWCEGQGFYLDFDRDDKRKTD